jgi:formylglycine-generating enzyme required for sulfatase activity
MVVLAPESMESQNVKDELSYAIDSGKYILPVVIKPCKVPLRLRRFQYVDFTDKPYKDSLADIKHLLSNTRQAQKPAPVEEPPVIEVEDAFVSFDDAMAQRELVSHPEPLVDVERLAGDPSRRKAYTIALLAAVVGIAAIAVYAVSAARGQNVPAAPLPVILTETETAGPPTNTPTVTPTPLPRQITSSGAAMMLVSAGEFVMGSDGGPEDEGPAQTLFLSDFYIDKYEVTNASYKACVDSGQCDPPDKLASRTQANYYTNLEFKNYPVVYVTWEMANNYCIWRGARLPTEAEWEKAARGPDGNIYPWGEEISCDQANYSGCSKDTQAVNSFEAGQSVYDVLDLAGNVSEWVNSLYAEYPYDSAREDTMASGERVVRGGSFSDSDQETRATSRQKADPATAQDNIGFRCAGMPSGAPNQYALVTVTPTPNAATKTKEESDSAGMENLLQGVTGTPTSTPTETATPTPTVGTPTDTGTPTPTVDVGTPTDTPTPTSTPTEDVVTSTPTPTEDVPPTSTPTEDVPPTSTPTDEPKPTPTPTDEPPPPSIIDPVGP